MDKRFLAQCEKELLSHSGAIQPHGTLLVLDARGLVSHVGGNVCDFLGGAPETWLGQEPPPALAGLLSSLGGAEGNYRTCAKALDGRDGMLDVILHRGGNGAVVLELTQHMEESGRPARLPPPASQGIGTHGLTDLVAELTGFQRVMYYRFREEGDGEVVAETRHGESYGSYMGLRFPASDIPLIARNLYLKNPWRLIPDAAARPVAVLGQDGSIPDLSWSDLRSVSPVHQVYLANMGVRASLSFPVVVGGNLTALVAAHHRDVRQLPLAILEQASTLVRSHTLYLASQQSERRIRLIDTLSRHFDVFPVILARHGDLASAWPEVAAWLMYEFQVEGAALCVGDDCHRWGSCFEEQAHEVFDRWFLDQQEEFLWTGDSLSRQIPRYPLSEIAGVLAIRVALPRGRSLRLYLTRVEHIHEVAWGGNPEKPVEHHDGVLGIAPRHSFEKWVEKRMGYSRAWDNESRLLGLKLRELLQREAHSL